MKRFWIREDTGVAKEMALRESRLVPEDGREALRLHQCLPGYEVTPLVDLPSIARSLGISRLMVKDESSRLGLPAFKVLGASWAVLRALEERFGGTLAREMYSVDGIRGWIRSLTSTSGILTLAAATDGNHGRAVAYMARVLGFHAHIFVPRGTTEARIAAITGEGAEVSVVNGTYYDAVRRAQDSASKDTLVIADTEASPEAGAGGSMHLTPKWVVEGYSTIFAEVDDQLERLSADDPDVVIVQMGVGALASATLRHYKGLAISTGEPTPSTGTLRRRHTRVVGVEPDAAACVLASLQAGKPVVVPGPHESIMVGLNCDTPSPVAWPSLLAGLDAAIAVDDAAAIQAVRHLYRSGLVSGETGAAGLAGLEQIVSIDENTALREALGIGEGTSALVLSTEGATDPASFQRAIQDG
ncbi:MAG: diaminopropionate ammonia-lyase [Actinobacteria bacterium]|nr:diaminopropionate ammonia-lyase [Actinomycetota bacterium]MCL5447191.1 diaminopropionate ammonia-lyase [Actinomycetota bacterium]